MPAASITAQEFLEMSDTWSDEDRRDLANFSLHYADAIHPEQEEVVVTTWSVSTAPGAPLDDG